MLEWSVEDIKFYVQIYIWRENVDIEIINNIEKLENTWQNLYTNNKENFIFQSYNWMKCVEERYNQSTYFKQNFKYQYILFTNNKNDIIIPIIINKKQKILKLMGEFTQTDYQDFIYNNITIKEFNMIIDYLKKEYSGYNLILDRINERSIIAKYLIENKYEIKRHTCVKIEVPNDFELYFKALSKKFKQNIRTNYNRIKKAGYTYHFQQINSIELNKKLYNELFNIYSFRRQNKINNKNLIQILKQKTLKIFRIEEKHDMLFNYINKNNSKIYILWINNKIAAFMVGLESKNDEILVPRLAINTQMSFYGPGNLLVLEFLKAEKNYKYLDLTRGNEEYKFNCGGKEHQNYEVNILL